MTRKSAHTSGSTLVVTIAVVATLLALLGVAVNYSSQISRNTQRTRKTAVAMEIADGHLEALFTNWRNIYRTTWTTTSNNSGGTDYSLCGGNFFFTASYQPGPAPTPIPNMSPAATPPIIPLPSRAFFPSEPDYSVPEFRIQGVDPMVTLDANGDAIVESNSSSKGTGGYVPLSPGVIPPAAYGPNTWQYSFYYLASVDVTVPSSTSKPVTAKVRRVFEKKFDQPWTYAMFFVDDLELQPVEPFTITGPVHTNGSLYIGNNKFTAASAVEYSADYVNAYSPKDPRYPGSGFTAPNFAKSNPSLALSDCPPAQVSPYLPWGWSLSLNATSTNGNDDGYHEIVERPITANTDPLKNVRYFYQPGYQVVIAANTGAGSNGNYTVTSVAKPTDTNPTPTPAAVSGTALTKLVGNNGQGSSTTVLNQGRALYDPREGASVKVTDIDIKNLIDSIASLPGWTGVLYLADAGAAIYNADGTVKSAGTPANVTVGTVTTSTTKRAFRLINGWALPSGGLTIVSENPVYIQGNFNTSTNKLDVVPSNNGTYTSPISSGYTRKPAAVVADAITVLSGAWLDANSASSISARAATNTTVNAALVAGNVPSNGTRYSGGGENFIRLLEDWKSGTFCHYGSVAQLFASNQAIGAWNGDGNNYKSPLTYRLYYDNSLFSSASPPGNLQIAAYLQQQRWYQVY